MATENIAVPHSRDVLLVLMNELTLIRALVDGARALVETCEHTIGDESLCHVRTLLDEGMARLDTAYAGIDESGICYGAAT